MKTTSPARPGQGHKPGTVVVLPVDATRVARKTRRNHPTSVMVLPVSVDVDLVPIIKRCRQLGLQTRACCQGTPLTATGSDSISTAAYLGYISFERVLDATVFCGVVGSLANDEVLLRARWAGECQVCHRQIAVGDPIVWISARKRILIPRAQQPWLPDRSIVMHPGCCQPILWQEGSIVRFRNEDIPTIARRLAHPTMSVRDLLGAATADIEPHLSAPRRCALPMCGRPIPTELRKDARYCCRKHQLADRKRGMAATNKTGSG